MQTVVQGWSGAGLLLRLGIVVLTGVTWAAQGVQKILLQPHYYNPTTVADYFTVYAYSAALILTAASLVTLRDVARPLLPEASNLPVVAAALGVTGVANGLEDGLGMSWFGLPYIIGVLVGVGGIIVVTVKFWTSPARRLTFVPCIGGLAIMAVNIGGGVLGPVAWLGFSVVIVRERLRPQGNPGPA